MALTFYHFLFNAQLGCDVTIVVITLSIGCRTKSIHIIIMVINDKLHRSLYDISSFILL